MNANIEYIAVKKLFYTQLLYVILVIYKTDY